MHRTDTNARSPRRPCGLERRRARARRATFATLVAASLGACAGAPLEPEGSRDLRINYSGRVTVDGTPREGIRVRFTASGAEPAVAVTDAGGRYSKKLTGDRAWTIELENAPPTAACPSYEVPPIDGLFGPNRDFECVSLDGAVAVAYASVQTTCEAVLAPYQVSATATAWAAEGGTRIDFQFPDAPAPVAGLYDVGTLTYSGSTGIVDLGDGLQAEEMWELESVLDQGVLRFVGSSGVYFKRFDTPLCERMFNIAVSY